jgi:GT2 family glycosyltransferase
MTQPKVSLIVPAHNYGRYVCQAIDSVLTQTMTEVEVIVIDDCSTDNTGEVLSAYDDDDRVQVIRHTRNQGHINTYNEGLNRARGCYVGLLSADDYCLQSHALARQVAVFEENPRVGLVYSAQVLVPASGPISEMRPWPHDYVHSGLDEFRQLMKVNYVPASGTLIRREVQDQLGLYDPRLPHSGDWDMWLRAFARGDVGYIAEPLYAYRVHGQNMSIRRISPGRAIDDLLLTMGKAFEALPDDAPAGLRGARRTVLGHALFRTAWIDLYAGRRDRAWRGFAYALRYHPALALNRELASMFPQLLLMTVLPKEAFWQVMPRLKGALGRVARATGPGDRSGDAAATTN